MNNEMIVHPFEPVVNDKSKILILGSFPSVISRQKNFYYANKSNRFWKVMEDLFHQSIDDQKQFCLEHGIALWDVIYSCHIKGSSDSSIADVKINDIEGLLKNTDIHTIFTTGGKASDLFKKYVHVDCEHISLPSTSGANARMRLDDLVESYQIILRKLNEKES